MKATIRATFDDKIPALALPQCTQIYKQIVISTKILHIPRFGIKTNNTAIRFRVFYRLGALDDKYAVRIMRSVSSTSHFRQSYQSKSLPMI